MSSPDARRSKTRIKRLAIWTAFVLGLIIWGALQPPSRLEPVGWVGTLDI